MKYRFAKSNLEWIMLQLLVPHVTKIHEMLQQDNKCKDKTDLQAIKFP